MIHDSHQKHAIGYALYFLLHFTNAIVTHKPLQITRHVVTQQKFLERGTLPIGTVSAANDTDWLPKCGLELRESSEGKNGDDQCWILLPEKRQIPWLTVDIV